MAINYKYEQKDKILMVSTSGKDESLEEVLEYARNILGLALKLNCTHVLCDERQLEYNISFIDTYELAEAASKEARSLRKIAIVCDPKYLKDGGFFETVAQNRGLIIFMTSDYEKALEWLD